MMVEAIIYRYRCGIAWGAAARAVLSGRATAITKSGDGQVEMLRMFKLAKASAIKSRNQAINRVCCTDL